MQKIFISKDPTDLSEELFAMQLAGSIEAKSLIAFQSVSFACPHSYDILFISSIRAADYFFSKCKNNSLIACAGEQTARKLFDKYQLNADFVAKKSGNPISEAAHFNTWRNGRKVCFPVSQLSVGTYTKNIPDSEKIILQVYTTQLNEVRIGPKDIYVFTSPSNVAAFFKNNTIASHAKVLAWGQTTNQALLEKNVLVTKVLDENQQEMLVKWLSSTC